MATRSVRWLLVQQYAALFSQHPLAGPVAVHAFPPGEMDVTDEMIVATKITSVWGNPNQKAGRQERDESITVEWAVMVNGLSDEDTCMSRFDELVAVIDDTVADDRTLDNFDGQADASVTASEGVPMRAQDGFYVMGTVTTVTETRLN